MNFSYIDDPEWGKLDNETQQKVIGLAFQDNIASDAEWTNLSPGIQKSVHGLYTKDANEYSQSQKIHKERGLAGDIASNLARGVADLGRMGGYALKTLDPDGGIDVVENIGQGIVDIADKSQDWDIMQPDRSEAAGEGLLSRGWKGGVRSAVPSLAPTFTGAAAGAAIGSVVPGVGTAMGGLIGGTLATFGLFGLGTYGEKLHEYKSNGVPEPEAEVAAFKQGLIEGGIEGASSLLGLKIFGVDKFVAQPLKNTVKELLETPMKTWGKRLATDAFLNEIPTEMLQGALGVQVETGMGLQDEGAWREAMVEAIIPAMTMSLLFGLGSSGMTAANKHKLKIKLNDMENGYARIQAVETIKNGIKENEKKGQDGEVTNNADSFGSMALIKINAGLPIDINADFSKYASQDKAQIDKLIDENISQELPSDTQTIPPVKDWEFGKVGDSFKKGMEAAAALKPPVTPPPVTPPPVTPSPVTPSGGLNITTPEELVAQNAEQEAIRMEQAAQAESATLETVEMDGRAYAKQGSRWFDAAGVEVPENKVAHLDAMLAKKAEGGTQDEWEDYTPEVELQDEKDTIPDDKGTVTPISPR